MNSKASPQGGALYTLSLLVLLIVASLIRLYGLGDFPRSFHQDEAMLAYDAWSVWKTGADQHGAFLPTHFRAFNEYLPGTAQYLAAPFVGILGLEEASARLPFALLGILTVFFTERLGRLWFGGWAGWWAALLLAIDPWHVFFSRLALVNSIAPIFTVLALYSFTRATTALLEDERRGPPCPEPGPWPSWLGGCCGRFRRGSLLWLAASALFFALLLRTYQPLKLQAPLLFGIALFSARHFLGRNRPLLVVWPLLFLLFASPQIIDQVVHWDRNQLQFRHNNLFNERGWLLLWGQHYAEYFDASRLFYRGMNGGMIQHGDGIGNLFWLEGPLWIVAVFGMARRERWHDVGFSTYTVLGLWFLTYPLAASLTMTSIPSENRTVGFLPCPELLAGYGVVLLLSPLGAIGGTYFHRLRAIVVLAVLVASVLIYERNLVRVLFVKPYLETRRDVSEIPVHVGLPEILRETGRRTTQCDIVHVEEVQWIYYLFATQYPPDVFQNEPKVEHTTEPDGFLEVRSFRNVRFARPDERWDPRTIPPRTNSPCKNYLVTRDGTDRSAWNQVYTVNNAAGVPVWRLYERAPVD